MAVEGEPAICANADVAVGGKVVAAFNGVDILDAEPVTASQDGAGVMGLVNIFEDDGDLASSLAKDGAEAIATIVR